MSDTVMDINVRNLTATYKSIRGEIYAVNDVDFDIIDGQSMGIAGESACGKSTLGLSIIRVLNSAQVDGQITMDADPILDMTESEFDSKYRWRQISMIFQGAMNSLDPVFTVKQQFVEILDEHGFVGDYDKVISDAVSSVGLDDATLSRYPHELSGGMKQRVVIAMALLLKPKFVIADEPTTALDVLIQAQIINLLKDLKKEGMAFMLITHDLAVLSEISDMIGIMYGGQMVEFGSSLEVYKSPKHPYTQALLKSIPTLHGKRPSYIEGMPPRLSAPPTQCRFLDRCPEAIEKCKENPPKFKTKTGYVRCWLYE